MSVEDIRHPTRVAPYESGAKYYPRELSVDEENGNLYMRSSDDSSDILLNLRGPVGPTGATGSVGPTGPQGPAGTSGGVGWIGAGLKSEVFNSDVDNYADGAYSRASGRYTYAADNYASAEGYGKIVGSTGSYNGTVASDMSTLYFTTTSGFLFSNGDIVIVTQNDITALAYVSSFSSRMEDQGWEEDCTWVENWVNIEEAELTPYSEAESTFPSSFTNGSFRLATTYQNGGAFGIASHTEGFGTIARGFGSHVEGRLNLDDTDGKYAHITGIGTSYGRKNGFTVDWTGNGSFAGTVTSTGADYAEFFEWTDGNINNEDRIGFPVTLVGDKIAPAHGEDAEILGIVSGTAAILGDDAAWEWARKYETDNFGRIIYEEAEEFEYLFDENGNVTGTRSLGIIKHPKLNSKYNPNETYIPRSQRPEWAIVGMFGKIYVRDDGTCKVGGYAKSSIGIGRLSASEEKTNIRVLKRIANYVVQVLLK